jgi:cytosine/adenosine deaminase-related metal-dependent hydrolase
MSDLFIRKALAVAVMDDARTVLRDADVHVHDDRIVAVRKDLPVPAGAEVLSGTGRVVIPGMVNTHHHLYQTMFRNVPGIQDAELFPWLKMLYPLWRHLTPRDVHVSALTGLGELMLTGCTLSTDHFYLFPSSQPDAIIDETVNAARTLGLRFHPTRGSMSRGVSKGGLPPDDVVQDEAHILRDCERFADAYHDPRPGSRCRVALAPCSPFSVTPELMRDVAALARSRGLRLHTHLAETLDEERFCIRTTGQRPLAYMASVGWLGSDVWYAHGVHFNDEEVAELGRTRTGIAHCPGSNLRLGSGIARVPDLLAAGAPVGLAVDGSASNDASDLLAEARLALLVHRIGTGVTRMSALDALWIATRGGAAVLGWDDVGSLEPGKLADLAVFRVDDLAHAGGLHDPVASLVFCGGRQPAETVLVGGRAVVREHRLVAVDEGALAAEQNARAAALLGRGRGAVA